MHICMYVKCQGPRLAFLAFKSGAAWATPAPLLPTALHIMQYQSHVNINYPWQSHAGGGEAFPGGFGQRSQPLSSSAPPEVDLLFTQGIAAF